MSNKKIVAIVCGILILLDVVMRAIIGNLRGETAEEIFIGVVADATTNVIMAIVTVAAGAFIGSLFEPKMRVAMSWVFGGVIGGLLWIIL